MFLKCSNYKTNNLVDINHVVNYYINKGIITNPAFVSIRMW